jgi:hypothetical protein
VNFIQSRLNPAASLGLVYLCPCIRSFLGFFGSFRHVFARPN